MCGGDRRVLHAPTLTKRERYVQRKFNFTGSPRTVRFWARFFKLRIAAIFREKRLNHRVREFLGFLSGFLLERKHFR